MSRVDAGTIELVRQAGVEVVSSGDLVQRFAAVWDDRAIDTHRQASEKLYRIKDRAFDEIRRRLAGGGATTEYDIQEQMAGWFDEGLVSDSPPNVSAAENAGNPHYLPTATAHRAIRPEELVLLDLWGKLDRPGAVFADITWVGYTGLARPTGRSRSSMRCARRATPRSRWCSGRWPPARSFGAGRSIARPRPSCEAPATGTTSCIGPATAWARRPRQRREHGRLRNARRPASSDRNRLYN